MGGTSVSLFTRGIGRVVFAASMLIKHIVIDEYRQPTRKEWATFCQAIEDGIKEEIEKSGYANIVKSDEQQKLLDQLKAFAENPRYSKTYFRAGDLVKAYGDYLGEP